MNDKYSRILGYFNPFGAIVTETKSVQVFNKAVEYFFDGKYLPNGIFDGQRLKEPNERTKISQEVLLEYLEAFLTSIHEDAHFYQISSCPLGVFLFKSNITKSSMIQRQFIDFSTTDWISSGKNIYIPILRWHEWMLKNYPNENITKILDNVSNIWENFTEFESTIFYDGISDIPDVIDSTQRLVMVTSKILNRYFKIPENVNYIHLITKLPHSTPSAPSNKLTTLKIIEAYAKLVEINTMLDFKIDKSHMNYLIQKSYSPIYFDAIEYVQSMVKNINTNTIMGILDLALFTQYDSLFNEYWNKELLWEDLYPGYRVQKIVELINKKSIDLVDLDYIGFYDTICDELEWPLASDMLNAIKSIDFIDPSFNEVKELIIDPNLRQQAKRSVAEPYMFELAKRLANLRLQHSHFVHNPYLGVVNSQDKIVPFIRFVGDGISLGDSLGFPEHRLIPMSVRYNLLFDLLTSENYPLTRQVVNKVLKNVENVLSPKDLFKKILEGLLFLPEEKIHNISELNS